MIEGDWSSDVCSSDLDGKTGRVIQQELFIAEGTFKAHTRHIYEKMGINSRKELFGLLGVGK